MATCAKCQSAIEDGYICDRCDPDNGSPLGDPPTEPEPSLCDGCPGDRCRSCTDAHADAEQVLVDDAASDDYDVSHGIEPNGNPGDAYLGFLDDDQPVPEIDFGEPSVEGWCDAQLDDPLDAEWDALAIEHMCEDATTPQTEGESSNTGCHASCTGLCGCCH